MARAPLRILLPVDGSKQSLRVLPVVSSLMERRPLRLTAFRAARTRNQAVEARFSLKQMCDVMERRGLRASSSAGWGPPAREILTFARARGFDWIAMSTHGRTGLKRLLMGSVAEAVLRKSRRPVLINRPGCRVGSWSRIVVALDGSPAAEEILPDAVSLAKSIGAKLYLIRVRPAYWPGAAPAALAVRNPSLTYLNKICARVSDEGAVPFAVFRRGLPARQINRFARDIDAGLICMTTHGRSGLTRTLMGSVAEQVIRKAPCPVLVRRSRANGRARKKAT